MPINIFMVYGKKISEDMRNFMEIEYLDFLSYYLTNEMTFEIALGNN